MRPVTRPPNPHPSGPNSNWHPYGSAQAYLIQGLGEYCSYCERHIPMSLAVEHLVPKSVAPGLEEQWDNYLLACNNCNSSKSNTYLVQLIYPDGRYTEINPATFCFFPDRQGAITYYRSGNYQQDSFNVLEYREGGLVSINPNVQDDLTKDRVIATISLMRLDRVGDENTDQIIANLLFSKNKNSNRLGEYAWRAQGDAKLQISARQPGQHNLLQKVSTRQRDGQVAAAKSVANVLATYNRIAVKESRKADYRAIQRHEAWEMAEWYRRKFDRLLGDYVTKKTGLKTTRTSQGGDIDAYLGRLVKLTVEQAKAIGFWSVWVTVFKNRIANATFNSRPAITPVLKELLKTTHFPGTRPNTDFAPPIYTLLDETTWTNHLQVSKNAAQKLFDNAVVDPKVKEAVDKEKDPDEMGSTGQQLKDCKNQKDGIEKQLNEERDADHPGSLAQKLKACADEKARIEGELKNERDTNHVNSLAQRLQKCNENGNRLLADYNNERDQNHPGSLASQLLIAHQTELVLQQQIDRILQPHINPQPVQGTPDEPLSKKQKRDDGSG